MRKSVTFINILEISVQFTVRHTCSLIVYIVKRSGGFLCLEGYLCPGEPGGEVLSSATGLSTSLTPDCIPMFDGVAKLRLSTSFVRLGYSDCVSVLDTSLSDCVAHYRAQVGQSLVWE